MGIKRLTTNVTVDDDVILVAIDPGTTTLGISALNVNLSTGKITILESITLEANKAVRLNEAFQELCEEQGDRRARLESHKQAIRRFISKWMPAFIGVESAFMGLRVNAFEALIECMSAIKDAVYSYDKYINVKLIPPSNAKKAVGVVKKGSDKDDVKNNIIKMHNDVNVNLHSNVDLSALDEHSIDSIAVGIHLANEVLNDYGV